MPKHKVGDHVLVKLSGYDRRCAIAGFIRRRDSADLWMADRGGDSL